MRSSGGKRMFLGVKHIEPAGLRVEREIPPPRLTDADGRVLPFDPVRLSGVVSRRRDGFRFRGELSTVGTLECARCLEPFRLPLEARFDLFYAASAPAALEEDDPEYKEDAQAYTPLVDDQIDLAALVSEQIYLNLPLKPLCGEGCRGLCPGCGANRNLTECGCETGVEESGPVGASRGGR